MTISVWRYSHLALAVSSFIFIALASVTGIILSLQPIDEKIPSYRSSGFDTVTVAQAIPVLKENYSEITEITVDINEFVLIKGTNSEGEIVQEYVNPNTGKKLGVPAQKNDFFQWVTALHRSLFLHELGRFFVGLTSFLLLLIALSGTVLVIRRQRGVKRFFTKIVKENFAQYYHVVLGRLMLIPIILIALTGTYLSLVKFGLFPEQKIVHNIPDELDSEPELKLKDFAVFNKTLLSQVQTIEFPFSEFPEDYFRLKLKDRELVVNQFTGDIISEVKYPTSVQYTNLSLDLHTGRKSVIWSVILAIACINILFFIYSGFVITIKRRGNRIKNKYKAKESNIIILVGSENGTTLGFANAVHQQLIKTGKTSFIAELNSYTTYPNAEHIVVITATYGVGDPPTNAVKFQTLIQKFPQAQSVHFSVVGFGSHAYPDFCKFAFEVNNILSKQSWAIPLMEIHTINDKSPQEFKQWLDTWAQLAAIPTMALPEEFSKMPAGVQTLTVLEKTSIAHEDGPFLIKLQAGRWAKFSSGDLLAIYPANDYRERLYSIGKIGKDIQLSVKLHKTGLGSSYLYNLKAGDSLEARIVPNPHFMFPAKAPAVIMICNGTGIAPFLGMIDENINKTECHLYCGFRGQSTFSLYKSEVEKNLELQKLFSLQVAYSREGNKQYVKDLLAKDAVVIAQKLAAGGVIMLCGSLAMQNNIIALLETICQEQNGKSISFYQSHGKVLMDCY
jgi:sulfite reductase (NADPH) flavoprotein alpha-component